MPNCACQRMFAVFDLLFNNSSSDNFFLVFRGSSPDNCRASDSMTFAFG